ncbi:MAG TPA: nucleoside recognition protein [Ruminiclostridium sp.]|nr:nucleoside recognition protein [Ruminiclostridium sp.]
MLNIIWVIMIFTGIASGLLMGRTKEVSDAFLESCVNAVELSITMLGAMCLWSGMMKVAQKAGLVDGLAKLLRGVFKFLFPGIPKGHAANGAIAMSISADLMGLGNAATPLGIIAMKELSKINGNSPTASNAMVMFAVVNAACIQLIPATVLIIRQQAGSASPTSIIPTVWIASLASLISGIAAAKLLEKRYRDPAYGLKRTASIW